MNTLLLADTPNLFQTVVRCHGTDAMPDYAAILNLGRGLGDVSAYAFVNPGVSPRFVEAVRGKGFKVIGSKAEDVDDALIASAVRLRPRVDWVVLCSGDGDLHPPRPSATDHRRQGWRDSGANVLQSGTSTCRGLFLPCSVLGYSQCSANHRCRSLAVGPRHVFPNA